MGWERGGLKETSKNHLTDERMRVRETLTERERERERDVKELECTSKERKRRQKQWREGSKMMLREKVKKTQDD